MDKTEKILESIEEEICTLLKNQPLNPQSIDLLAKLTDSMKDVVTASGMKDYVDAVLETDDGMSHAIKMPKASYNSFARGRSPFTGRFVSRDGVPMGTSMPHMSTLSYDRDYSNAMNSMGNMSNTSNMSRRYDGGYSGHSVNDRMIASLEKEYDNANSEYEKEQIRKEIEHLRNKR